MGRGGGLVGTKGGSERDGWEGVTAWMVGRESEAVGWEETNGVTRGE
jgi:hypothetical protein